jgi:tRNA modification GTPase
VPDQVVLLTPPGPGAIAVVRLTGPRTAIFLRSHFSKEARVGRCMHGVLRDGEKEIDDPVVVLLADPFGADISVHGGPWVVRCVLELARHAGFELIETAQLPLPLTTADGLDILEREVMAYLPMARSEAGVRTLLGQRRAWEEFRKRYEGMAGEGRRQAAEKILADMSLWRLLNPPRVAIVGAPNVGKSTLANQLFGQERSITADIAGTTRDWVGEIAEINGLPVMLVDTPGLRPTDDLIERQAIEQSREQIHGADLVVLVLDVSRALEPEQSALLGLYPNAMVVLNKADHPRAFDASAFNAPQTIATTAFGVQELRDRIAAHFGCASIDVNQPRWWTPRQRDRIARWLDTIDRPAGLFEILLSP